MCNITFYVSKGVITFTKSPFFLISLFSGVRTTTVEVRRFPVAALAETPSGTSTPLEIKTEAITSGPSLMVKSGGVTNVPIVQGVTTAPLSLQVRSSEGVGTSSLLRGNGGAIVASPPSSLEVKTEAVSSTGPTITSHAQERSLEGGAGSSFARASATTVTGTGSVTATPTAYTTAVTTIASTTTVASGEVASSSLGKRIRRQSSKYEDYEQQTLVPVRRPELVHVRVYVCVCVVYV